MVAPKCAGQKITAVRYSTVTFLLMLMLKILSFSLFCCRFVPVCWEPAARVELCLSGIATPPKTSSTFLHIAGKGSCLSLTHLVKKVN